MSSIDLRRVVVGPALALALVIGGALSGAAPAFAFGDGVRSVAVGGRYACALRGSGTVWCWGEADKGQLGDGTTGDADGRRLTPVQVKRGNGSLTGITKVAAGQYHACALREDGAVFCWGDDEYGQLGDGTTGGANHYRLKAVRVRKGSGYLSGVRSVAAGSFDSCAVRTDGRTWCWGDDGYGELGDGATQHPDDVGLAPVRVKRGDAYLAGTRLVGAGAGHACVARSDGTAWCWGYAGDGQVGDGTRGDDSVRLSAVQVRRGSGYLTGVERLGLGTSYHSCAVRADGAALCWGSDFYGELGDGTTGDSESDRLKAVRVRKGSGYLSKVRSIASGWSHTCAARTDGSAWCWGQAAHGEVGDGTTGDAEGRRMGPVRVVRGGPFALAGVTSIGAGSFFSCAALSERTAWCWGENIEGQLGDGTTETRSEAVRVQFP